MQFSKSTKVFWITLITVLMSHLPHVIAAEKAFSEQPRMIPTSVVLAEVSRAEAEKEVRDYLSQEAVRAELLKQGVSADEATARLATLSEQELRQLSGQVKEARAGGDILVAILLVVLIIFLVKRI